jgi:pimeloyl-ACP methyl ester carboxylesterase
MQYRDERRILTHGLATNSELLAIPNGRIEVASVGEGAPVLVCHGTLAGYDQGLGIASLFMGHGYRFLAVSRAGYLRSDLETGSTGETQADSYTQLLDVLDIPSVAVIGVSGGGPSALQFALRYPDRCWGVVMISAINQLPPPLPRVMEILMGAQGVMGRFDFLWWLFYRYALSASMVLKGVKPGSLSQVRQDRGKMKILKAMYRPAATTSLRIAGVTNDDRQIQNLPTHPPKGLTSPLLVVHSPNDPMVPYVHAEALAQVTPGARLVTVEEGGHVGFIVQKELVVPEVINFLDSNRRDTV